VAQQGAPIMGTSDGSLTVPPDAAAQVPLTLGATANVGKEADTEAVVEVAVAVVVASLATPPLLFVETALSTGVPRGARESTVKWSWRRSTKLRRRIRTSQRRRRNVKIFGKRCVANTGFYRCALHTLVL
jgi:hypothetical protein